MYLKDRGARFGPGGARAPVDRLVHGSVRSQAVRTLPERLRELAGCFDFPPLLAIIRLPGVKNALHGFEVIERVVVIRICLRVPARHVLRNVA